jgi:hypothetical protein
MSFLQRVKARYLSSHYASLVSIGILLASMISNVVLLGVIFGRLFYYQSEQSCPVTPLQRVLQEEAKVSASYPFEQAHLSHLVIALHESGAELGNLAKAFAFWQRFPPCLFNSYPTNWSEAHVTLVMALDGEPTKAFANGLLDLYYGLPKAVRSCFAGIEIRHAGIDTSGRKYNETVVEDIKQLAKDERAFLSAFLGNRIDLKDPSHALLMTSDTIPIQSNWLNLLDYETRTPVERFWIKGSLYRGNATRKNADFKDALALNRVALYNIGDPALSSFYETAVRPYIAVLPPHQQMKPWEADWSNYLFVGEHYAWNRALASIFRPTDAIQDHTGCAVDIAKINIDSPDTVLLRVGQIPPLPAGNHDNLL